MIHLLVWLLDVPFEFDSGPVTFLFDSFIGPAFNKILNCSKVAGLVQEFLMRPFFGLTRHYDFPQDKCRRENLLILGVLSLE